MKKQELKRVSQGLKDANYTESIQKLSSQNGTLTTHSIHLAIEKHYGTQWEKKGTQAMHLRVSHDNHEFWAWGCQGIWELDMSYCHRDSLVAALACPVLSKEVGNN